MLALLLPLKICLSSLWSPPFPPRALTPIFLSLIEVQLLFTSTLSPLTIWCSGQTALFLFLLARAALAYLPTALSVILRPLFHFRQAQYVQISLLKPAPFCMLFSDLDSTNKCAISLLVFSYLTLVLSSPPCPLLYLSFYLKLSGRSGRNCLLSPPILSGYNGSSNTRFSQRTMRLMIWPNGEHYLHPLQSLVVSLLSLVSTLLFPWTSRIKNLSCSACRHWSQDTSNLILQCPAADSLHRLLFVYLQPLVQALGSLPSFWGSMVLCHATIPQKGPGNNNNNNYL